MGDPREPADGTTSSEGEGQGEVEDVAAEQGQADDGAGQSGAPAAPDSGTAAATAAVHGFWSRHRRVVFGLGAAIAVGIVIAVGGVAAGSGPAGDRSSPRRDTTSSTSTSTTTTTTETTTTSTTTSTSTTTTAPPPTEPAAPPVGEPNNGPASEPATDDGVMTPITEPSHTVPVCGLGPWGESHTLGTVPGPPEQAKLIDGPNWNCTNAATGCRVSISTTWSDGVTASDSRTLTTPGTYTLDDGRGTTATFSVTSDLICVFNSADYSNTWPSDF